MLALRDILLCKGLRRNVANNNGTGQEQIERDRRQLPSLVEAGRWEVQGGAVQWGFMGTHPASTVLA